VRLAWSNRAKDDLKALRQYSIERWGRVIAQRYLEDVRDAAKATASDPRRSRRLRGDFHIVRVRSHALILNIDPIADRLTIARVLHSAMDLERHLP